MKVLITGGGGFLGHRLAHALLDTTFPDEIDARLRIVRVDLSVPGAVDAALDADTAAVFHLAAVVSADAEADFDLGMRVNVDGTRLLLEACRRLAGSGTAARVRHVPDPRVQEIVATWPVRFETPRALAMGFSVDPDIDTVIRDYMRQGGTRGA